MVSLNLCTIHINQNLSLESSKKLLTITGTEDAVGLHAIVGYHVTDEGLYTTEFYEAQLIINFFFVFYQKKGDLSNIPCDVMSHVIFRYIKKPTTRNLKNLSNICIK